MVRGLSSNNKSGIPGVSFCSKRNKWRAYIGKNGEFHGLGYFSNIEDAIKSRKSAEEKYFGEYAYNDYE